MNLRLRHVVFTFFRRHDPYFILMFTCTVSLMETSNTLSIEGSDNSTDKDFHRCHDNMLITSYHYSGNFFADRARRRNLWGKFPSARPATWFRLVGDYNSFWRYNKY